MGAMSLKTLGHKYFGGVEGSTIKDIEGFSKYTKECLGVEI